MWYALVIGSRYLRSKKRSTISVITTIAVTGVALGVAALLAVMSITAGFQEEFRTKVLGVNAHVLVLRYGLDFSDYREGIARARALPEVAGAAPFEIDEMMLARGERLSGVLVKGIDPALMPDVLDLPEQLVAGSLDGLRLAGSAPPTRPEDLERAALGADDVDLDRFLADLTVDAGAAAAIDAAPDAGALAMRHCPAWDPDCTPGSPRPVAPDAAALAVAPDAGADAEAAFVEVDALPEEEVLSPEAMQALLDAAPDAGLPLPTEEQERAYVDQMNAEVALRDRETRLPGLVVGVTLARTLGIQIGDEVKIISPLAGIDPSLWRPGGAAPRSKDFRVVGIFEAGFQEYDTRLVYADLHQAQLLADRGDTVTGVELRLHDLTRAPDVARRLERDLGGGPYHTLDWQELNHNLFTALEIQKVMLSLVIATIIFVAAFNVVATLIMVVLEKKREIAILKAMGAKDSAILSIFLLQGTVVGVIGTLLGLVVGGAICAWLTHYEFPLDPKVYLIDHLPVRTSPVEFALTVAIALAICVTATLVPSWWAARLLPADGVRYE
jgi:lipoprotein-releasing system permease protein